MSKKWYNYIVSVDESENQRGQANSGGETTSKTAAQSIAEIASTIAAEPQFTTPVSDPTSFEEIYKAAEIPPASKGYSILKVSQMLESEHIRNLPSDVRKSSILVALDAAGVDIKDVIQDAIRRDRALDTYERVQQRAVEELETKKTKENTDIQAEIDKYVTEQRAKIQANNDAISREKERFTGWRLKKQQQEKKIAEAVGYFVTENPITTGEVSASSSPIKVAQRS
ncbi:MAG TPA: hypothetical protein VMB66_11175 [Candidatus Acidoferrales bacterium]|nr:hypothetical protein [Candidatus Acidoferrales bacterium]